MPTLKHVTSFVEYMDQVDTYICTTAFWLHQQVVYKMAYIFSLHIDYQIPHESEEIEQT